MSQYKLVETFLESYYTYKDSTDVESRDIILDLEKAIKTAPLTTKEKLVLAKLYFNGPQAPERDKLDKNGETRGRPSGGTTTVTVAQELGTDFRRISEIKTSAIQKIADTLGEQYGL